MPPYIGGEVDGVGQGKVLRWSSGNDMWYAFCCFHVELEKLPAAKIRAKENPVFGCKPCEAHVCRDVGQGFIPRRDGLLITANFQNTARVRTDYVNIIVRILLHVLITAVFSLCCLSQVDFVGQLLCVWVPLHDVVCSRYVGPEGVEGVAGINDDREEASSFINDYSSDVKFGVVGDTGELKDIDHFTSIWIIDSNCCIPEASFWR